MVLLRASCLLTFSTKKFGDTCDLLPVLKARRNYFLCVYHHDTSSKRQSVKQAVSQTVDPHKILDRTNPDGGGGLGPARKFTIAGRSQPNIRRTVGDSVLWHTMQVPH